MPKFKVLHGEEAIKALHDYIEEINREESGELPERQKAALTKVAKALILSLEDEHRIKEEINESGFLSEIKRAILRPRHDSTHTELETTITPLIHHPPQQPIAKTMR